MTDDEADEEAQAREERRRRVTPVTGRRVVTGEVPLVCTEPNYVAYLERALNAARDEADNARAVFAAAGAHNAELTLEVERLTLLVAELRARLPKPQR